MTKLPISFRGIEVGDLNFILNSWLKSYRNSYYAIKIPNQIYYQEQKALISNLLGKSQVVVAVNQEDSSQILGFIMFEIGKISLTPVIHYIYVKSPFRKLGIGTELLQEAVSQAQYDEGLPLVITHHSREFEKFCAWVFVYNPYLLGDYKK